MDRTRQPDRMPLAGTPIAGALATLASLLLTACIGAPPSGADPAEDAGSLVDGGSARGDASQRDTSDTSDSDSDDSSVSGWWNPAWQRRVPLDFDPQDLAGPIPSFVAYVPLDLRDGGLFNDAMPDRSHVRFIGEGGEVLPHEVENWEQGKSAALWVRLDELSANTRIWLYFDNPEATGVEAPSAVWTDYSTVLHFPTSDVARDASGNVAFDCVGSCAARAGHVANGMHPSPTGYLVTEGDNPGLQASQGEQLTASIWYAGSSSERGALIFAESNCVGWGIQVPRDGATRSIYASASFPGDDPCTESGTRVSHTVPVDEAAGFHNVTVVIDRQSDELVVYHDGLESGSKPLLSSTDPDDSTPVYIASGPQESDAFDGRIDEVQISPVRRSSDSIAAHFQNLRRKNFITFGVIE